MIPHQLLDLSIRSFQVKEFAEASGLPVEATLQECIVCEGALASEALRTPCRMDAFLIGVCIEGEADVVLNLQQTTLRKHCFFTLAPNHLFQLLAQRNFKAVLLVVSSERFNSYNIDTKQLMPISVELEHAMVQLEVRDAESLIGYIRRVGAELALTPNNFTKDLIGAMVATVIYKIGALLVRYMEQHREISQVKNRAEEYFKQFVVLLGRHYLAERSVGFYADRLNITPKYLTTLIKRVSGRSVSQWVDYYVTIEAKTMLKFSDKSIAEISNALNFANQSFFGSYFRRNTGMSPSQYRAQR